jgi:[FeFe] hydrogenase H-cluster maturation GTPase HydF
MAKAPRGERLIIAITGKRNAGKSSLINAITGQEIAIVSEIAGTTTDPVDKHYELLPLGPVTFYDTAGIDDAGELGLKRIQSTRKVLYRADIAILVVGDGEIDETEINLVKEIKELKIPLLIVFNKSDLSQPSNNSLTFCKQNRIRHCIVSAYTGDGINACKEILISLAPELLRQERPLVGDLVQAGNHVVLVTPIDLAAPKGRLILPQVQVIRELLDNDTIVTVVKERELEFALESMKNPPNLVITDSQAILKVAGDTPEEIPLTTFSILFARYKGELQTLLQGARKIDELKDGDKILIAESCSHHVQCDDIGRIKIPRWLNQYTGKQLIYEAFAGHDFPENLESFSLAIHCGACMINPMEMTHRMLECERRGVPITNYGMAISKVQGLLERVVRVFGL